jgi:hypothetical protein
MYSYRVSKKWVYEITLGFVTKLHPELHPSKASSNAALNPAAVSSKPGTFILSVLCTGVAFIPPREIIPESMCDEYVFVLYICTDQPSYHWRPTQKQVDDLSELRGQKAAVVGRLSTMELLQVMSYSYSVDGHLDYESNVSSICTFNRQDIQPQIE